MRRLRSLIVISVLLLFAGAFPVFASNALPEDSFLEASAGVPVFETDVTEPSDGCVIIGYSGKYITDVQGALDRINEIRLEACKEGVRSPATNQPLTEADYVPIRWSGDLEYIARIRAAESSLTGGHVRTNGESCFNISSPNGKRSYGEVLAWSWAGSMVSGINQWYEEKADWVNQTAGAVTGHYTSMIDPRNRYVGLGTFYASKAAFPTTTAGEFSSVNGLDETPVGTAGECIQLLELTVSSLEGTPAITGDISQTAGEETQLSLMVNAVSQVGTWKTTVSSSVMRGVSWSSDDPVVAVVSDTGLLQGISCGETTIHAVAAGISAELAYAIPHAYGEWVTTKEASCEEDGHREKVCASCQDKIEETLPALGHDWDDGQVTQPATCTQEGAKVFTCKNCGGTRTEVLQPAGHQWNDDYTVDKEPTCTEAGSRSIHCFVCGEIQEGTVEELPALGHSFGEWKTIESPTCEDEGIEQRTCSTCGLIETNHIDPNGHDWATEFTVDKEATCTEEGSQSIHCKNCDAVDPATVTVIPAYGHAWNEGEVIRQVTCTEDGEKIYTCMVCGETRTETVTAAGHQWNSERTVDKAATCMETGSASIHCAVCGEIQEDSAIEIPKAEHTWREEFTVDREPTCTEEGVRSIHCAVCDEIREGSEESVAALGHAWDEGTVIRNATCLEDGEKTLACLHSGCGETRKEVIPALGHQYETVVTPATLDEDGKIESQCIHCGDIASTESINRISEVRLAAASYVYDGKAKKPAVTVKDSEGNEIGDAYYDVTYASGGKDIGQYAVTVTFKGNYAGEEKLTFKIIPQATKASLSNTASGVQIKWTKVSGATGYRIYKSGKPYKAVTGTSYIDTAAKTNGTTYSYKVYAYKKVNGTNIYSKASASVKYLFLTRPTVKNAKNTASRKMTVSWNKNTRTTGYIIKYVTGTTSKTVKVTSYKTVSKVISSLAKGKTYKVYVRCYRTISGKNYYSAWSAAKTVKITK